MTSRPLRPEVRALVDGIRLAQTEPDDHLARARWEAAEEHLAAASESLNQHRPHAAASSFYEAILDAVRAARNQRLYRNPDVPMGTLPSVAVVVAEASKRRLERWGVRS